MSEKDQKGQSVDDNSANSSEDSDVSKAKPGSPSRDDRLAEALRANLRRRKSAARARKQD
ncbi:hypothetical protein [Labrenzia sp. DG1229]|uniref:hypothetical protein n=1 Tax=Labrenzia sp. DG1229 TaxID=681847 RepID=UPI0004902A83|nr:hypothetical protein [Labrenzia sp. DG1229]